MNEVYREKYENVVDTLVRNGMCVENWMRYSLYGEDMKKAFLEALTRTPSAEGE